MTVEQSGGGVEVLPGECVIAAPFGELRPCRARVPVTVRALSAPGHDGGEGDRTGENDDGPPDGDSHEDDEFTENGED